jgi:hypothetical protein
MPLVRTLKVPVITLGADIGIGRSTRVIGEYGRRIMTGTDTGFDTAGAYLSLLHRVDAWTPYLSVAALKATRRNLDFYASVNETTVPDYVPGAAAINALQRAGADSITVFDQSSVAIGTSYSLSPTQRFKAELQRVRVGEVSKLVDAPPSGNISRQNIHVLSLSYSFVF